MRYTEILNEENANYEGMIQGYVKLFAKHGVELPVNYLNRNEDGEVRPWALKVGSPRQESWPIEALRKELKWAKENLTRKDRIIWYMRHVRIEQINSMLNQEKMNYQTTQFGYYGLGSSKERPDRAPPPKPELLIALENIMADALKSYEAVTGHSYPVTPAKTGWDARPESLDILHRGTLSHFTAYGDSSPEIRAIIWDKQSPKQLNRELKAAEEVWREREKNHEHFVSNRYNDEVVIKFPDGYMWVLLSRGHCSEEGRAMGHCGNGAGNSGDRILSLRKTVRGGKLKPYLTFVLRRDGALGEMKARFNEKPAKEFHPHIIELLKSDLVKSIEGGGYLAHNNFALSDLNEKDREGLLRLKPSLNP
jgi:hypothetical protein